MPDPRYLWFQYKNGEKIETYEGDITFGCKSGNGTIRGENYSLMGSWSNDTVNGRAKIKFGNDSEFSGDWKDG